MVAPGHRTIFSKYKDRLLSVLALFRFRGSATYWNWRYRMGGTSGAGSYGDEARYKAEFLNAFFARNDVKSVIDFGCGDGNQLADLRMADYLGYDVSAAAVERCRNTYAADAGKRFDTVDRYDGARGDVAMSLDVIYHLVEDAVYEAYLDRLFGAATRFVVIYSSDVAAPRVRAAHVRHRQVADDVGRRFPQAKLVEAPPRPEHLGAQDGTGARFFVFRVD